jgi:hypothetical protein
MLTRFNHNSFDLTVYYFALDDNKFIAQKHSFSNQNPQFNVKPKTPVLPVTLSEFILG